MAAMSITLDKSDVASAAMHVAKQLGYPEMKDLQVKVVVDFVCGRDVFCRASNRIRQKLVLRLSSRRI